MGRGCRSFIVVGLDKGVGNHLAAVDGGDKDEEGAAGDDQAEGSRGLVAVFVYRKRISNVLDESSIRRKKFLPRTVSCTSSRTRFISAS